MGKFPLVLLLLLAGMAGAADLPVFKVTLADGKITPVRIEVPAGQKFKIELVNMGKTPAEFESIPLRKEKVLAPGAESFVVVQGASKGEYPFFDDFHPQARGVIVVK